MAQWPDHGYDPEHVEHAINGAHHYLVHSAVPIQSSVKYRFSYQ
jgi:hypothetical protein